jgi:hypothetical protein
VHVDVEDVAVGDVSVDDLHEDVVHAVDEADVEADAWADDDAEVVDELDELDELMIRLVDDDMFFEMDYDACSLGMVSRRHR